MTKLTLTQPDWTRFMDPNGLAEKAGVPENLFTAMILKELTDNAADIGGASLTFTTNDTFIISDSGAGVPVEALSIKRPLTSSKHWGLGALAKSSF